MISVRHVNKRFGNVVALDNVSFMVPKGAIFGLIGPNGAGKTTCLTILATLLEPDSGKVAINGRDIGNHVRDTRRVIGYVPDFFGLTRGLTAREYLDFYGGCHGLAPATRRQRTDVVLEQTGLMEQVDQLVDTMSRGMKQRLALAKALIHEPPVLILDEPASGLDPRARAEIIGLLKTLAGGDTTILISSHILSELDVLCSHVGILSQGRMLKADTVDEILKAARPKKTWLMRVDGDPGALIASLTDLDYVTGLSARDDGLHFSLDHFQLRQRNLPGDALPDEILTLVAQSGARLRAVAEETIDLEQAFMELTEKLLG